MQRAIDVDPKNPLAKFEKASVLMSLGRWHQALQELSVLKVGHAGRALTACARPDRFVGAPRARHWLDLAAQCLFNLLCVLCKS